MSSTQTTRRQYNGIDLMKYLMSIIVVAIHTYPLIYCENEQQLNFYNNVIHLAVPFFFLASGFFLAKKLSFSSPKEDAAIIRAYMFRMFGMYFLWMLLYTPVAVYYNRLANKPWKEALSEYIKGLFLKGEQFNAWPLWYLLSTAYTLVIVWVIVRCRGAIKSLLILSLIMSMLSFGCDWLVAHSDILSYKWMVVCEWVQNTIGNGRMLRGGIYLPLGMCLTRRKPHLFINLPLFVGAFILDLHVQDGPLGSYLLVIKTLALFGVVESIQLKDAKIYRILRDMSTVIYLIHMYVWMAFYFIKYGYIVYGMEAFVVTAIASTVIAFVYVLIRQIIKKKGK